VIIDCHAHFDPRMLELDAVIAKMDSAGIDRIALIPTMNDPLPHTPEVLLAVFRRLMDSRLHPCASWMNQRFMTKDGHLRLRGHVYRIYAAPDNRSVGQLLERYPERFLGWIFLNPRATDDPRAALEELEEWRSVPGFVGVKLHPHWHGWSMPEALPIAKRCEELRLPILIHLGFGERGAWQVLTERCPKLRLIFAHAGMPHFSRCWPQIADNPNLCVDLSSPYLDERMIRRAVAVVGPERALYGTDAPYGFPERDHSYDYTHIKGWIERLPCRADGIDRILGANILEWLPEIR
jgi:predicted TIM-barrel fold metal-dependent hydrolase